MTTSLKDVDTAIMIRELAELGCFAQDVGIFGYAWVNKSGKIMYTMSENELLILQSFEENLAERCCMTPIQVWHTRAALREETQEDIMLCLKLQLAKQMQDNFNRTYFDIMAELQDVTADDLAEEILENWQEELDGYFEEDALHLFEGAVQYAFEINHLRPRTYQNFMRWAQQTRKQMIQKMQVHDNFDRTFYGVAYREPGSSKYLYITNANENALYQQVRELDEKGKPHSPVYKKRYWFKRSNDLPQIRRTFEAELKQLMNEEYLERLTALQTLPSAIPEDKWKDCMKRMEAECTETARASMNFWKNRWNVQEN